MTGKTDMTKHQDMGSGAPGYQLPPITLLDELPSLAERTPTEKTAEKAKILQTILEAFGVQGEITHVEIGPTFTSYEITPAPGVRVERIAALEQNIAMVLSAGSLRIQTPIPGKNAVCIEVPNTNGTSAYLRELVESPAFYNPDIALPFALGKDVRRRIVVGDLAAMSHVLIVGEAESGKTVCLNSLLTGLLLSRTPEQLRMILVDQKTFEFQAYENLRHLVMPIITNTNEVLLGLRWAIKEMEKRYALFKTAKVRDIAGYNGSDTAPARLPHIVIVVDEMAEMMSIARPEIEPCILRLAVLSRAAGIHMVLATQCPSVNVITGMIKSNIPGRIAFRVAQGNDSRTILDALGAEKLLGKGDMLYLPPGKTTPVRLQGAWTSDNEMHRVTDFIRSQGSPEFLTTFEKPPKIDEDYLLEAAIKVIRDTKTASTSSLQHHLKIGYNDAFGLMVMLEEKGIVGPPVEIGPREILIDLETA